MPLHHYLPRFYLRHFVVPPHRAGKKNRHVLTLRKLLGDWEEIHPDRIGAEENLNTIESNDGTKTDILEEVLQKLDDAMARVIRDYIEPRRTLLPAHRETVARFAALLQARHPSTHRMVDKSFIDISEKMLLFYKSLPDRGAASFRELKAQHPELTIPDGFDLSEYEPERFEMKTNKAVVLRTALESMESVAPLILGMRWTFAHAPEQYPFITSDTPVTIINMDGRGTMFESGLGYRSSELTFPITPSIALTAVWSESAAAPNHLPVRDVFVRDINSRTILRCRGFLVASDREFPGRDLLDRLRSESAAASKQ